MMFKKNLVLLIALQFGCEANPKPLDFIAFLKDAGYQNLSCDLSYNKVVNSYDFTANIVPKNAKLEMLLARCDESDCSFEVIEDSFTPAKVLCQRFHDNEIFNKEFKRDRALLTFNTDYFLDIKE